MPHANDVTRDRDPLLLPGLPAELRASHPAATSPAWAVAAQQLRRARVALQGRVGSTAVGRADMGNLVSSPGLQHDHEAPEEGVQLRKQAKELYERGTSATCRAKRCGADETPACMRARSGTL